VFHPQVATSANVDGESLMMAAMRLVKRREQRKVLMVLSDGMPSAYGIDEHLCRHLSDTVKTIEKMGIEVVGIGIKDDSVKRFYPKNVVISDIEALPGVVMGQLKMFLVDRK
jgi:cobaltochelatase CobT